MKRGKKGDARHKMEKVLRKNVMHRLNYHCGDFSIVKTTVLLQKVDDLFRDRFKEIADETDSKVAKDDEVVTIVNAHRNLGMSMDRVSSLARMPHSKLTQEKTNFVRRVIEALALMQRCLRISIKGLNTHWIEDHLVSQMILYEGIIDFLEYFVEQSNQAGVKEENRIRGLSVSRDHVHFLFGKRLSIMSK